MPNTLLSQLPLQVLIQGITGKEGQRALQFMQASHTQVLAGVTPGKGGQNVEGIPVFNTVHEAKNAFPHLNATSIVVPPQFVLAAAQEAIAAQIPLIHIFSEGVPTKDTVILLEKAQQAGCRIIGPASVGMILPGKDKLGAIGANSDDKFLPATEKGGVAVISKSGGLSSEIAAMLTNANIPQTLVVGIGGDRIIGTTYADLLPDLLADNNTKAIIMIGEIGGTYEEMMAAKMIELNCNKPVIAFISGRFAELLPAGVSFGHAGAVVSKHIGTRQSKIDHLREAGAIIVDKPEEIITIIKKEIWLKI